MALWLGFVLALEAHLFFIAPCRDMYDMDRGVDVMEREALASTASLGLVTSLMTRCPDLAWRC